MHFKIILKRYAAKQIIAKHVAEAFAAQFAVEEPLNKYQLYVLLCGQKGALLKILKRYAAKQIIAKLTDERVVVRAWIVDLGQQDLDETVVEADKKVFHSEHTG